MNEQKPDPTINVLREVDLTKQFFLTLMESEKRHMDDKLAMIKANLEEKLHTNTCHAKELREAESKRIDAIRAVDVAAVASANEKAIQQANVLATQLVATADSLNKRITNVESEQYKNQGSGKGMNDLWAKIVVIVLALVTIYSAFKK